jgi:hypothetical protein
LYNFFFFCAQLLDALLLSWHQGIKLQFANVLVCRTSKYINLGMRPFLLLCLLVFFIMLVVQAQHPLAKSDAGHALFWAGILVAPQSIGSSIN